MKVTVLGARGGAGRAITLELLARGHDVTAVTRSGATGGLPVRPYAADLADAAETRAACASAEVVVMAANLPYPQWDDQLWPLMRNALEGAAAAGARLVVLDNLYAYGTPAEPITADSPEAATTRKGALRREIGRRLLAADEAGRARVVLGRFSDYYGPGASNAVVHMLGIEPGLRGRTVRALGALDQPHTFAYLPDVARAFATLVEHDDGDGRAWVLPAAPAVTQRRLLELIVATLSRPVRIGRVTRSMVRLAALAQPMMRELLEMLDQFERPYVTDARHFEAAFGPVPVTPHEEAIPATVAAAGRNRRARAA